MPEELRFYISLICVYGTSVFYCTNVTLQTKICLPNGVRVCVYVYVCVELVH